jgi:hypothetical protein
MENVALIERLNRVPVSASDVERVLARIRSTAPQQDSFEATVEAVTCVLPMQSNDYRLAVAFRLHALTLVLRHLLFIPEPPKPGMGRMVRIAAGMIAAACRCKLISVDDQPAAFDLTEFKAAMDSVRSDGLSTH